MSFRKWFGLTVAFALLGVLAGSNNGCSSSTNTTSMDGGSSSGSASSGSSSGTVVRHPDGSTIDTGTGGGDDSGPITDDGSAPSGMFDMTSGKACTSDTDCKGTGANAVGFNKCSSDVLFNSGSLYPTAICLMPAACDPCGGTTPCDQNIHFCDGPDSTTSPGVCLPTTTPAATGKGVCLPTCSFKPDGSAPTGCQGKDTCFAYGFDTSMTPVTGLGYCYAGCTADTDCVTGEHCQLDQGVCLKVLAPPTSPPGAGCNSTVTPAPCNCISNATNLGFCSIFCTVGGSECASGWFCDAQEPTVLVDSTTDASTPGFTTQNMGMAGFCAPLCNLDAGTTTGTDSGACPTNSTCQTGLAGGPACLP